jgi:hypothetical protein
MPRTNGKKRLFDAIVAYLKEHGACKVAIFGSYARGDERPGSDIDVLVEFTDGKSLLDVVGMEQELSDKLGKKVELLTERAISPYIIDRVRREMVVVYG